MPPAFFVALGASTAIALILSSIAVSIATAVISTVASMLLQRKPKKNPLTMDDRTITVRQPLTPRQIVQGSARVGGTIFVLERVGADIVMAVTWAGHFVQGIDSIWPDDEQIFFDDDGKAIGARFGEIECQTHFGEDDQLADEMLRDSIGAKWSENHRARGRCYTAIRLVGLATNWDNQVPNFSASIRGKLHYDPRTGLTSYSTNAALAVLSFLTDPKYGYGKRITLDNCDVANFAAEANICDEEVALPPYEDAFKIDSLRTFTVNTTTDEITFAGGSSGQGVGKTGEGIYVVTTGTLPAPLATATQYFIRRVFQGGVWPFIYDRFLYPTKQDALDDTNRINFTTTGTGVHTAIISNSRFSLIGDTITVTANATNDDIIPTVWPWLPVSGGTEYAVVTFSSTGTLPAPLVAGTKYGWRATTNGVFNYPSSGGDINLTTAGTGTISMRILGYIVDVNAAAAIDTAADTIALTFNNIGTLANGTAVLVRLTTGTISAPLIDGNTYFVSLVSGNSDAIRLSETYSDALNGRYIDFTTASGTMTIETVDLSQRQMSGFTTGMACEVYAVGGAALPAPLAASTIYYLIRTGHGSFSLALTRADAFAGIPIAMTSGGTLAATNSWNIRLLNELRFASCGIFDTDQDKGDVLRGLLSACGGRLIPPMGGGKYKLAVAAYRMPMITLDEKDALRGIVLQTRRPRRETVNTMKGTFAGPFNFDQPGQLPVVSNAVYVEEDGGEELALEMNLPFTESVFMGVRILTIELERRRAQNSLKFVTTLHKGLQIEACDGVDFSWSRFGILDMSFECNEWSLNHDNDGGENRIAAPEIVLDLVEMKPEMYGD